MDSQLIVKAIKLLRPTAEFSFENGDYSTVKWDILEGEAPTLKEIEDAAKTVLKIEADFESETLAKKNAVLARLGITDEEAKALLS